MSCAYYINKHVQFRVNSGRADKHFIKTSQRRQMNNKKKGTTLDNARSLFSLNPKPNESLCICGFSASCSSEVVTSRCLHPPVLLTFVSVPGALRLKRHAGQAQYGEVSPTLEESSRRPDFFQLLPKFPRSSAHIHLIPCQSHFVGGKKTSLTKLKQATSSLIVDCIAVAFPAPGCHMSPQIFVSVSNLADNCIHY